MVRLDWESSTIPEDQRAYRNAQDQIGTLKARFDQDRITIISRQFPEIVCDAERFLNSVYNIQGAYSEPWKYFGSGEDKDEAELIQDKYQVGLSRQRPSPEHVCPKTDLFYEISGILYERKIAEMILKKES